MFLSQLQDTYREGEERKEEDDQDKPDVAAEDNAIEMSEDMGGKLHDAETGEGKEEESDSESLDENEIDKEMGELGEADADKLDEQLWGSDQEEEEEEKKEVRRILPVLSLF